MPTPHAPIHGQARRRAESLFQEALDLQSGERAGFLDRRCAGHPSLRDSVRSLLEAHERMGAFLDRAPLELEEGEPDDTARCPTRIGNYEILRVVGTGGMGIVYEARQENPRRRVAVKVIHPGLGSHRWLRRFEREAEVLGGLRHPGIATIHEAGEAEVVIPGRPPASQPFIAMEFIDGLPLDEHVRRKALDARGKLRLAARICDALQHAHEHGVVHRDLKPSNILVGEKGQPAVLDFGIARAIGPEWKTMTAATLTGQFVGTIPYMSPEQIGGDPAQIDARSDVYSLGVILYELLGSRLPVETRDRSLPEAMRAIREDEPSSLGSLDSEYRGDINAIVGKALRKDMGRRYANAGEFGADIRRHLRGVPIRAHPPSTAYRLRRFARRNRILVGGVAATIVALALGLVGTGGFAWREAKQRQIAEAMTVEAEHAVIEARYTAAIASLAALEPSAAARSLDVVPERLRAWEWKHLRWRATQHLAEIPPPDSGLVSLTVAQRASLLFVVDDGGTIRVWSLATGTRVGEFATQPYRWYGAMAASPDGALLLGDVSDRVLRSPGVTEGRRLVLWDVASGRELWRRPGAFSLGRELWRRPGGHRLGDEAWTPDGALVAVGPWGGRAILLLDPRTGETKETIPVPDETAQYPTFSPDGTRLVYYHLNATGVVERESRRISRMSLLSAGFADGGDRLIGHDGHQAVLVNLETGARTAVPTVRPVDWPAGLQLLAVGEPAFDSPGRRLLVPSVTGTVVRRIGDGRVTGFLGARVDPLGWTGDGKRVASIDDGAVVQIWDAATDARPARIPAPPRRRIDTVAVSPDGRQLATGGWRFVTLRDLRSGAERWNAYTVEAFPRILAFSPDGRWLATLGHEGVVTILDAGTGTVDRVLHLQAPATSGLAWLPAGDRFLIATQDGALHLLDAVTGAPVGRLSRPGENYSCLSPGLPGQIFHCIDVSRDGRRVAVAGKFPLEQTEGVAIWEIASGERLGVVRIGSGTIVGVALDARGERLAAAVVRRRRQRSKDPDELFAWDVASGERIVNRVYDAVDLRALSFSPEGRRIVLAADDGKLRFVDARADLHDVLLDTEAADIFSLSFSSDGKTLIAGTRDEVLLLETAAPPGGFEARSRATEARTIVDELYRELIFSEEVSRRIAADSELPEDVRREALDLVRIRGDHLGWLKSDAVIGYRATSLSNEELQLVLRKIEVAHQLQPDNPEYVATRGKCRYRAAMYREALGDLDRADAIYRAVGESLSVEDLAYVAMARWRLGEPLPARRAIRELESRMTGRPDEVGSGARASIEEARALVGALPAPRR